MAEPGALVIGGGPAGVAAAVAIAQRGIRVQLVEQRDRLGGAIHRQFAGEGGSGVFIPRHHKAVWSGLMRDLEAVRDRVGLKLSSVFLGIDGNGLALVEDVESGMVVGSRPDAVVVAVGAMERVLPRPGWDNPGVVTAGGMQVQIKETGEAPPGRTLLAGSGPLLLALAAQLCSVGRPPVAILDGGDPVGAAFGHLGSFARLVSSWPHLSEAAAYVALVARARVRYRRNCRVEAISPRDGGLQVRASCGGRTAETFEVEHLALHDGIVANRLAIEPAWLGGVPVEYAGDCRETAGAAAAVIDGRRAGASVAAQLLGERAAAGEALARRALAKAERLQRALNHLCAPLPSPPDATTTLCLCERRSLSDLQDFPAGSSTREVRLVGRFGMGMCQGRFCAAAVREASSGLGIAPGELDGFAPRWPIRPVSVAALASFEPSDN